MSYPAADRQYSKRCDEMRQLIKELQETGINLDEIFQRFEQLSQNFKQNEYENFLEYIRSHPSYFPLLEKAQNWKNSYDNLMSELAKWNEECFEVSNSSPIHFSNIDSPDWTPDDLCLEFDDWSDYLDANNMECEDR
jgi:DNA-binding transcriptional MerR regulator